MSVQNTDSQAVSMDGTGSLKYAEPGKKKRAGLPGEVYMILASVLFATGGLVLKFNDWNPLAVNGVRSVFGALVIGLFMRAAHHRLYLNRISFLGAVSYMLMTTLFVIANRLTAAGNAIILQYSCPLWIVLLSWLLFHKKPAAKEWIAMALIGGGILCFFLDSLQSGGIAGDLAALVSGLFYAVLFMLNSMKGGDALSSVFLGQVLAAVLFTPFSFSCTWTPANMASVFWLGAFQVGLAYLFFSLGTARVAPLRACLINGIEPVLSPTLCALAGFETLSGLSLLGAVTVIVSVFWYSLPSRESRPVPAEI